MQGSTIHWFNLLRETEDHLTYGGRKFKNPFEELSVLVQTGNVEEFIEAFELISSQVGRLPEEQYVGYFMSGLQPEIQKRVRTLNPTTRFQLMKMARDVEDELAGEAMAQGRFQRGLVWGQSSYRAGLSVKELGQGSNTGSGI